MGAGVSGRRVRRLHAWHRWTALVTGVFVFVLSLTGAVAVFRDEIDRLLTPARVVAPPTPGAARAPLARALDAVRARHPGATLASLEIARDPTAALVVHVEEGRVRHEVFVDPYTARVTGARTGETVANVVRQAHVRFYFFGWQGRVAVGLFGVALLVSSVTGLLIYAPFMKGLAFGTIRRHRLQLATADWHKLVGVLTLAFNVVIAVTGAVLGLENLQRYSPAAREALHPGPPAAVRASRPTSLAGAVPADTALARARAALPGVTFTRVELPAVGKGHYRLSGDHGTRWSQQDASEAVVETHTGRVLWTHDARAARPVTRAYNLSEPLHFGTFGGLPVRVLYALLGVASGALSITGYALWALKRRRRRPVPAAAVRGRRGAVVPRPEELAVR